MRWKTGGIQGINRVYETLRRWAVKHKYSDDRQTLCQEFARIAGLYGVITGTAGPHPSKAIERELKHLRALGIETHRPFTLRLLDEQSDPAMPNVSAGGTSEVFAAVGAWATRLWLADRQVSGMNRAIAELCGRSGPDIEEKYSAYWIEQIRRFGNTRVSVPTDEMVREGIRSRKAYGGAATGSAFAVLCALMESEQREESPARDRLTIEHVMPRTLTTEWKRQLGENAVEIHGRSRDTLANLTLSGDSTNSAMGASDFRIKRKHYEASSIWITRQLAHESEWGVAAMERRAEYIAELALNCWPWEHRQADVPDQQIPSLRWRIGESGPWNAESYASQMVLNVVAELLDLDPQNAVRLSGEELMPNIHSASTYPPGTQAGSLTMRSIPRHERFVMYPYAQDYQASAQRCRRFGERCQLAIEVEFEDRSHAEKFWEFLRHHNGGLPGKKARGEAQARELLPSIPMATG